ncbi:NitT/TauT family transport system permease protein [Candidatus Electrothrix aarhusensis]|uniref:NitT/TauT family transport system permease protein n=1 Tax=Candidatus Electrothrix aarhusensis TaxID=1859131 RepID=A0A444ITG6_9BACT|nr:NitT/TauT family transport system permease protein [Candidatus Electrothrix aarhusensis]
MDKSPEQPTRKPPRFFGIHARPGKAFSIVLAILPFAVLLIVYLTASEIRHRENEADKLLPKISQMTAAVQHMAFEKNRRTGTYLMLNDTLASMKRLLIGTGLAAATALLLGLNIGLFPGINAALNPFITFIAMIPPLSVLPILFISFGVDEAAKIVLIFLGIFPLITRDIRLAVHKLPHEQLTKAATLGASQFQLAYRIILPQVMPRLIEAVRLSLGSAWLFLIAAEAIAASSGLGYRIFLVRRYLAMDVILPYVLWITFLGFVMDWLLRHIMRCFYPWYAANGGHK